MATSRQKGFTVVEMLVVAPVLILAIGAFVLAAVLLTGESISAREKNTLAYDTQAALDEVETNINRATTFLATTGSVTAPQGSNDLTSPATATAPFTNVTSGQPDSLILQAGATTYGPNNVNRTLIYNGSGTCNPSNGVFLYTVVYFVRSNILYKRTFVPSTTACATPWQKNSCYASLLSSYSSVCKVEDDQLMANVSNVTIQYYSDNSSTTPLASSAASTAGSVSMQIDTSKTVSGKTITYSATLRAAKLN